MKLLWNAGGILSFGLGAIGAVVPLLPTVPFMLLAAFCFARGSDRFHAWLIDHDRFGPPIRDWQAHGAIRRSGKIAATVAIVATFAISVAIGLATHILAIQACVLTCVGIFIWSRPDGPTSDD
ncbi:MAG: YbaN family protein [Pseudomonadota bacterium]